MTQAKNQKRKKLTLAAQVALICGSLAVVGFAVVGLFGDNVRALFGANADALVGSTTIVTSSDFELTGIAVDTVVAVKRKVKDVVLLTAGASKLTNPTPREISETVGPLI